MATQILKTSGDYEITTGTGAGGSNQIILNAGSTRILGNLEVDGTQTVVNSTTVSIQDPFIELIKNNSSNNLDGGIYVNTGTANNPVLFWSAADGVFKAATTTNTPTTSPLTSVTLARLQAASPSGDNDVATKGYVTSALLSVGASFSVSIEGDDNNAQTIPSGNTIKIAGGTDVVTSTSATDTVTINLKSALSGINSITSSVSNGNLTLSANGTGKIVLNNVLEFGVTQVSDPTALSHTQIYTKTAAGGETGIFFNNTNINSGTAGELISKKKAVAYSIALS